MTMKKILLALIAAGVLGAGGYGLYSAGMHQGMKSSGSAAQPPGNSGVEEANGQDAGKIDPATGKRVLYWHDPMVPGHKFDKPGKSPFMDMQLVPVYAGDAGDEGTVSISPRVQQNLGIRTAEVSKSTLAPALEAVGSITYNERDVTVVQARSSGYVERLHVRAALDPVRKGQPLAQVYVPDWIAAQEEYLAVRQMQGPGVAELRDAARQRMRLAGMTDDLIRLVESSATVQPRLTIRAPISGVVADLAVQEGMTVMSGAPLFRINGLDTIWVLADVPEGLSGQLRPGMAVEARASALPGTVLKGKVSAILPEVDSATRTLKARVELKNPGQQLVPGMFATINFTPASREQVLTVPTEAVIQTGKRSIVIVAEGDGKFAPVEVDIGIEANGQTEIRKGLKAGQKVVVSGQFLIDSEASLKGVLTRMSDMPAPGNDKAAAPTHRGTGKVESISDDDITLSHGPIPSLQWGEMTMGFLPPAEGLPKNIAVGDSVVFEIRQTDDGMFQITSISPTAEAPKPDTGSNMPAPSSKKGDAK